MGEAAEDFIESSEICHVEDDECDYDDLDQEMFDYPEIYLDD